MPTLDATAHPGLDAAARGGRPRIRGVRPALASCHAVLATLAVVAAWPAQAHAARPCDYSKPTLEDIGEGAHPTFSADGEAIIFNSTRGQGLLGTGPRAANTQGALRIYRAPVDPATGKFSTEGPHVECLTCEHPRPPGAERSFDGTPQVSPDGEQILFVSSRDHEPAPASAPGGGVGQELYVMNADGSNPVRLTETPRFAGNYHPQWSRDGKRIFWGRNYNDLKSWELLVADYDEEPRPHLEHVVRLTGPTDTAWYEPHGFSPNGRRVIFTSSRSNLGNGEIYTMELELGPRRRVTGGGELRRLTDNPYWDEHAHYSPDGHRIAFVSSRDHPGAILGALMKASYDLNLPSNLDTYVVVPGVFLLAASARDPVSPLRLDIYLMNRDGSGILKVTDDQGAADLDWSPDGSRIVFRNRGNRVGLVSFDCRGTRRARAARN